MDMSEMLERIMAEKGQQKDAGLDLSTEEVDRFRTAFKDKEFQTMMAEYMEEIGNPASRAENEAYISQLEREDKVPQGKKLVRPKPGFVVKTKFKKATAGAGDEWDKLFINCVESGAIEKPTSTPARGGQQWSLPHAAGPLRMEKDKKGANTTAFDVCFHPDALAMGKRSKDFNDLVVTSALEVVERAYESASGIAIQVERKYHVLQGVAYKSGEPSTILMSAEPPKKNALTPPKRAPKTTVPNPAAPLPEPAGAAEAAAALPPKAVVPPAALVPPAPAPAPAGAAAAVAAGAVAVAASSPPPAAEEQKKPSTRYTIVERGLFQLGDHMQERDMQPVAKRPTELAVRISLPAEVKRASELVLDIAERKLKLSIAAAKSGNGQEEDYVSINLPYPVVDTLGKAKFDKTKKVLVVTLPVKPPVVLRKVFTEPAPQESQDEGEDNEQSDGGAHTAGQETQATHASDEDSVDHTRWVSGFPKGENFDFKDRPLPVESTPAAPSTGQAQEESQPDSEEQQHVLQIQKLASDKADFIPALTFVGAQAGYCFKLGDEGLGYYVDDVAQKRDKSEVHSPELQWLQTDSCVTLMVQVPNINPQSVVVKWGQGRAVSSTFATHDGATHTFEQSLFGEIDPSKCRYDVASKNMVMVMYKAEKTYWESLGASEGATPPALEQRKEAAVKTLSTPEKSLAVEPTAVAFKNDFIYDLD